MKVLLDEMYSDVIAVELRARGHDAVCVREVIPALAGALDEEVLRNAAAQERICHSARKTTLRTSSKDVAIAG